MGQVKSKTLHTEKSLVGFCENSSNGLKATIGGNLHVQTAQHQHVGAASGTPAAFRAASGFLLLFQVVSAAKQAGSC